MNKPNYGISFNSLCRTCLDSTENMKSVQDPNIINMLKICVNIQVYNCLQEIPSEFYTFFDKSIDLQVLQGDGLPDLICLTCLRQIYKYFDFKQLCEKSDAILKQFASDCSIPVEFQVSLIQNFYIYI